MDQARSKLSRRQVFAGAGTAGALAAVATLLPRQEVQAPQAPDAPQNAPERGGGYQVTQRVLQYYQTARL